MDIRVDTNGIANKQDIYNYLTGPKSSGGYGYSPSAALGLMGNMQRESSFKTNVVEYGGGSGVGLFQYTEPSRKAEFISAVPDWQTNAKAQIDFALTGETTVGVTGVSNSSFLNAVMSSDGDVNTIQALILKYWEIPKDLAGGAVKNMEFARDISNNLTDLYGAKLTSDSKLLTELRQTGTIQVGPIQDDLLTQIIQIDSELADNNITIEERDALIDKKQRLTTLLQQVSRGGSGGGRTGSDSKSGQKVQIRDLNCSMPKARGTNPIHDLRNYTYRLIISTLSQEDYNSFVGASNSNQGNLNKLGLSNQQVNFPKPKTILIASGGYDLDKKNEYGVQDFFFQELTVSTLSSAEGTTGADASKAISYSSDISFTLIEPLGTTLFERLFYASQKQATFNSTTDFGKQTKAVIEQSKAGNKDVLQALTEPVFLLTIEFKGYRGYNKLTSDGLGNANFLLGSKSTSGDYKNVYYIPFIFAAIDTDITSAGTTYRCKALPAASQVFFAINQALPSTSSIKENQSLKLALDELSSRYTDNQKNLPDEFKKVKYVFRVAADNELPENESEAKSIARELEKTIFRGGPPTDASRITFTKPVNAEQKKDGRISGGKSGTSSLRPALNQNYYTGMGTTAIEALHQIMLKTEFITKQVELARKGEAKQGIWWYNIRGNMLIDTNKDDKKSPHVEQGKTFEYIIEPYKIYVMNDIENNGGCDLMTTFRNYEYIFTGKNNDIIRWDMSYDGLLYSELQNSEPASTTAQPGQPSTNASQSVNATGQKRGTSNQNKVSFPTINDISSNGNHQKIYKFNWFSVDPKNGGGTRVQNYQEMQNASFMESLFRQQTSSQQWELDIDIIGDPEYLASFDALSFKRKEKKSESTGIKPNDKEKQDRLSVKQSVVDKWTDNGQYLIGLQFKTPTDVDPVTLSYKGMRAADLNGIYVMTEIKHIFRNGKFIQTLHLVGTDNKCCPEPNATRYKAQPKAGSTGSKGQTGTRPSAATNKQLADIDEQLKRSDLSDEDRINLENERTRLLNNGLAQVQGAVINPNASAPIPGATISSGWNRNNGDFHGAIDYEVNVGTPVQASVEGTVIAARWQNENIRTGKDSGYGKFMVVERTESNGSTTHVYLAHLSEYNAQVGSRVNNTDVIARSGNTGHSDGPHLHYEVRTNATPGQIYTGTKTNPMQYNSKARP